MPSKLNFSSDQAQRMAKKKKHDLSAVDLMSMRHTCEHVLHLTMDRLFPGVRKAMGPATAEGFYFDADFDRAECKPSPEDFERIEAEMARVVAADLPVTRREITLEEGRELFGNNPYKVEWLDEIALRQAQGDSAAITTYEIGTPGHEFYDIDLCKGPHVESTGQIGPFKLLSLAGAYWHGDEKNKMLDRIYGTCFQHKDDLKQYLWQQEEAKKRDHRKLGQELELFHIDEMVGKGLVLWLPKGNVIKEQVENFAKEMEDKAGYQRVSTPHIAKEGLYLTSGHLPYYKDSMYPPMEMDDGTYYMKAMNCPHHHRIYGHRPRSYRELPLRFAEYGMCYRNELSGTLAGLLRVRALNMNDAHLYLRKSQIRSEFEGVMRLTMAYFDVFGLKDYWFRLSKWDPAHTDKYINEPENWDFAESELRSVLESMGVPFVEVEDEAAFYGPKVDVQFKSVVGREETMSTIQLDFLAKARFGLSYIDEEGKENGEVFVIHRAPLSTHERFMAFLIEHYAGVFPVWLAPVQAMVIPIADRHVEYGQKVLDQLRAAGIRAEIDERNDRMNSKIRDAQNQKIPYMLVLGDQEIEANAVALRLRDGNQNVGAVGVEEFIARAGEVVRERRLVAWDL